MFVAFMYTLPGILTVLNVNLCLTYNVHCIRVYCPLHYIHVHIAGFIRLSHHYKGRLLLCIKTLITETDCYSINTESGRGKIHVSQLLYITYSMMNNI